MIVVLTVLLLSMLVGCVSYEMERASDIESAAPHSQTCRSHVVKGGDHSSLYCPNG